MSGSETAQQRRGGPVRGLRDRVRALPGGRLIWRIAITIVGLGVIVIGVVLLPLPGPGWLIIFAGIGILGTEYTWAARLLIWVRARVVGWTRWIAGQPLWVRLLSGLLSLLFLAAIAAAGWFVAAAGAL